MNIAGVALPGDLIIAATGLLALQQIAVPSTRFFLVAKRHQSRCCDMKEVFFMRGGRSPGLRDVGQKKLFQVSFIPFVSFLYGRHFEDLYLTWQHEEERRKFMGDVHPADPIPEMFDIAGRGRVLQLS